VRQGRGAGATHAGLDLPAGPVLHHQRIERGDQQRGHGQVEGAQHRRAVEEPAHALAEPAQAALHGAPTSMKVPATITTARVEPSGV